MSKIKRQSLIIEFLGDPDLGPLGINDLIEMIEGEPSEKTISRDIKELRNMGAKITRKVINRRHKYKLENEFHYPSRFAAQDLLDLTILRQAVRQFSGSFLEKQLEDLSKRIASETLDQREFSDKQLDQAVSFKPHPAQPLDAKVWEILLGAVLKCQEVKVDYVEHQGNIVSKQLYPYHITCLEGEWYLLAGKSDKPKPVQYSFANITRVEPVPGKNHFQRPADFDPKKLLAVSFGRMVSLGKTATVRVQISGFMVRYVRNRVFQASQKVVELDGGKTLEISFEASAEGPVPFGNVASWVLSMGPCAKVIGPPELIKQVKKEAAEMLKLYQ